MFGRVQYKQWDPGIAWFQFWGQQAIWEIESPLEKVIVIRVVQQQTWWFLSEVLLRYQEDSKFGNSVQLQRIIHE